jgi:hypothetical protein
MEENFELFDNLHDQEQLARSRQTVYVGKRKEKKARLTF